MTPRQFVQIVESVTFKNSPFDVKLLTSVEIFTEGVVVAVKMRVPDRDTGVLKNVMFSRATSGLQLEHMTLDDARQMIRCYLHEAATHEVDEALHFNGARVFDPHWMNGAKAAMVIIDDPIRGEAKHG